MSIMGALKNEFEKELEALRKENGEVHAAVIRKQKELLKIRGSLVTEVCPHCDCENTIEWNVVEKGYQAYCPNCGKILMLCSQCMLDTQDCSWDEDTGLCHRKIEEFWKELADVPFREEKDGTLVLEDGWKITLKSESGIGWEEIADFPEGTEREEIWHWFNEHHPKGVAYLMNGEEKRDED